MNKSFQTNFFQQKFRKEIQINLRFFCRIYRTTENSQKNVLTTNNTRLQYILQTNIFKLVF